MLSFEDAAAAEGAVVRNHVVDATGWRWRVAWEGTEIGAWNDIDGVAIVADIGPFGDWVGLAGRPPDPSDVEALQWAISALRSRRPPDGEGAG
ncbi:MAG TPA: hypothetical protein VFA84_07455 [Acidimicrobiales bacterium]|nr:hypothetical protein [Acidimicrobiales bacterium]